MVYVSRLTASSPSGFLTAFGMKRVMSTDGRHLLKPLQVNNFVFIDI